VDVQLDKITNRLATPACPETYTIAFIEGTEPHDTCEQMPDNRNFFQKILGMGSSQQQVPVIGGQPIPMPAGPNARQPQPQAGQPSQQAAQQQPQKQEKKKGFFGKLFGAFSGDDDKDKKNDQQKDSGSGGNNSPRQ
jgi:penicillin-binding protein 1B